MQAAQITGYGSQDVLQVTNRAAKPTPGSGQVLVAVQAAGMNPFDYKVREGLTRQMAELDFPATLGGDLAGTVAEIGPDVKDFAVGQAVYGQANALSGQGSFAEFAPVKAESLASKPVGLNFVEAAAAPLVTVSAYQALVEHMQLQAEQKILIHGGAGGIGSMAIQLAKYLGAYVATTAAPDDLTFVRQRGADEAIDYTQENFAELINEYDAVYDTVGGDTNANSYTVLKRGGVLVSMVEKEDEARSKQHGIRYVSQFTRVTTERLEEVAQLFDKGVLQVAIDKVFPLEQAAEALEYLHTAHPRGKVVIQIKG